jgi:hypothetical protein
VVGIPTSLDPNILTTHALRSDWFAEYDWQAWDRQLEADVAAGKLDKFGGEALTEFERGETTEL